MKTPKQLRNDLATIVQVELQQEALDAIDGCQAVQPYEFAIADRIINHLTTLLDSPEMVHIINEAVCAAPSIECAYDVIAAIKKEVGCE